MLNSVLWCYNKRCSFLELPPLPPQWRHIRCIFPRTCYFIMLEYWLTRNVEHISVNKRAFSAQTVWTKIFLKSYTQVNWIVARAVITTWRLGLSICSTCIFGSCWFTGPWYGYVINLSALFNASTPDSALSKFLEALCNIDCSGVKRIQWLFKQLELNRQTNEKWSQIWFVIFSSFSFTLDLFWDLIGDKLIPSVILSF